MRGKERLSAPEKNRPHQRALAPGSSEPAAQWPPREPHSSICYDDASSSGGARGPVILPAFKAGDSTLREPNGGFDSHTLPPTNSNHTLCISFSVPISTFVLI